MGLFSSLFSSAKAGEANEQKVDRKHFDTLKYDGIRALRIGKPAYALKCFTEALNIQKDLETMKYLIVACNSLDNTDLALETLNGMVESGEEPANAFLMRATFHYTMGNHPEALADCAQVIALEPDNSVACFYMAKSALAMGDHAKAITHLDQATDLKDDFAEAFALRADIYLSMEKGQEALTDIEKVIALTPEDEAAYLLRGRIYEQMGNEAAALNDYQQTLEGNPFNEAAYLLAGKILMAQGKHEEAILLFDEAIEHIDQFAQAYAARALAKRQSGDPDGAQADEETAKELNPDETEEPDENHNFDNLYKGGIF